MLTNAMTKVFVEATLSVRMFPEPSIASVTKAIFRNLDLTTIVQVRCCINFFENILIRLKPKTFSIAPIKS